MEIAFSPWTNRKVAKVAHAVKPESNPQKTVCGSKIRENWIIVPEDDDLSSVQVNCVRCKLFM